MARTRTAPWDYDKRDRRRTDAEDEILAIWTLKLLQCKMKPEAYQSWRNHLEGKSWAEIDRSATDMLNCIARSDDEADQRQTLNDARGF